MKTEMTQFVWTFKVNNDHEVALFFSSHSQETHVIYTCGVLFLRHLWVMPCTVVTERIQNHSLTRRERGWSGSSHKFCISDLTCIKMPYFKTGPIHNGLAGRNEYSSIQLGACSKFLTLWYERTVHIEPSTTLSDILVHAPHQSVVVRHQFASPR